MVWDTGKAGLSRLAKVVLHVGCGGTPLPSWLDGEAVRLDIDPDVGPDIVASMTDMGDIGPFDAVYSSHSLEHLYPHEVPWALAEFLRVLKPGGAAIIFVPDLEDVKPTDDILYVSPGGSIAGFDLIYGHRASLQANPWMAHHTGFISGTLAKAMSEAGFQSVKVERLSCWNLFGVGLKVA